MRKTFSFALGLIILFGVILLLPSVLGEVQSLGVFKQNTCIELLQVGAGFNSCNITSVVYPNSVQALGEVMMTQIGNQYNYSFCSTEQLGQYIVNGFCTDGNDTVWVYDFAVTPTGISSSTAQGIGGVAFLGLMLILTLLGIYGGTKLIKNKTWWVYGILAWGFSIMLLVYDVWLGYEYSLTILGSGSSMPQTIFWMFLFVLVAGFLISVALLFLRWKEVLRWFKQEVLKKQEDKDDMDWMEKFG